MENVGFFWVLLLFLLSHLGPVITMVIGFGLGALMLSSNPAGGVGTGGMAAMLFFVIGGVGVLWLVAQLV